MNHQFFFRGVLLLLTVAFFLNGYFLESLGIIYAGEGGSPLHKIHLYSYLVMMLFVCLFLKFELNYIIIRMGDFFKVWLVSFAFLIFVIFYGIVLFGTSGMAYLVNTFLSPLLLLPIICVMSIEQKQFIVKFIAYLLLLNCCVAIIEYAFNTRMVNVEFSSFAYFRSTAFLTHPLNNALISVALLPYLLHRTVLPTVFYFGISILALFAFGGRAALGIYLLMLTLIALPSLYRFVTSGVRMNKLTFSLLCFFSYFFFIALVIVVFESGIGDRILNKLHMDGSASARVDVFYILELMSPEEWLFGATDNLRGAIDIYLGISVIENYIIGWIFTLGVVGTVPLLISFLSPLLFFIKKGEWSTRVAVVGFLIVSITNNSLTTKTPILLFLYLILLINYFIKKEQEPHI
ncbi:VpsF family polysaccharide biosynthesis protein [Psychromonas sp. Urea-02u-13]|uniref:VpsF family polysaccharide biosynthesis protein n=1 Tax=Psychromonas sp. Urea-02u-13 TaxID=2058326 RepID=UPI000C3237C1|nr:VpsF family polysaccharide biosynthesis protein [Psychromonas sp. Urea-02u-13]PKG37528.1 hypothetical protein CXF74_18415 [Psychromonas sp. Urea-02u-13]